MCPICKFRTVCVAEILLDMENPQPGIDHEKPEFALLLDNIRSAWNTGSMLRTADGAGIQRVYLCGITPTPEHPRVARTSLGSEHNLTWSWHPNSIQLANRLIAEGKQLWGLEATADASPLQSVNLLLTDDPVVLVVGNEITGIDPDLLHLCSRVISLPMQGIKRSLNVAVALGIAVYHLLIVSRQTAGDYSIKPEE
jgi:tRNA G18 (ribose-2'-O)-methylase SpoU